VKRKRGSISRLSSIVAGLAAVLCLQLGTAQRAQAEPVLDAAIIAGVDQDMTAIGRLVAGGFWDFGRVAPEVHIGLDGFLPLTADKGIAARSFSAIDVGARYGIMSERYFGAYLSGGVGFGLFWGKPHERKVDGDEELCASANIPPEQDQDQCAFRINRNANVRLGFGWGFASGKKTTVGARIDIGYWMFSVNDYEDQPSGAPVPRLIPRPQAAWTLMLGLEFMRWK